MKFRLLYGTFEYHGRVISASPKGPSEVFESPIDLCAKFKNKFQRIEDAGESLAQTPLKRVVIRPALTPAGSPAVVATPVNAAAQAEARKLVVLPVPPPPPAAPAAPKALKSVAKVAPAPAKMEGVDVTAKYPAVAEDGGKVMRNGILYTAYRADGEVAIAGVNRKKLEEFLAK